ncbi:MAG: winged helix-turn-helix domain-containing protein, partial [Candidatus Binatia bacterium]
MESASSVFFPPFRFDLLHRQLWRGSELIPLRPKTLAVLSHLIDHAEQVITREELLQAVWPKMYVNKASPKRCIQELRAVLGDNPAAPRFIATIGRQGYRFIAPLSPAAPVQSPKPA